MMYSEIRSTSRSSMRNPFISWVSLSENFPWPPPYFSRSISKKLYDTLHSCAISFLLPIFISRFHYLICWLDLFLSVHILIWWLFDKSWQICDEETKIALIWIFPCGFFHFFSVEYWDFYIEYHFHEVLRIVV